MISIIPSILLAVAAAPEQGLPHRNPLYRDLLERGVAVSAKDRVRLASPTMADGLDKQAQMKVINSLATDIPVDELMRRSVVASHVSKVRDIEPSDPEAPAHGVDVWFVAYGDYKSVATKDVDAWFNSSRRDLKGKTLSDTELRERNIHLSLEGNPKERLVFTSYSLLEKVQISMTTYTIVSQSDESIVLATTLDPRFAHDKLYPNSWQSITTGPNGELRLGPPHSYNCTAMYTKITRLIEPKGALFVEIHRISTEPKKWFDGANLLRPKLPMLIQAEVRSFRREAAKTLPKE